MSEVKLNDYEVLNDLLLLQWGDGSENALPLKSLREIIAHVQIVQERQMFLEIYTKGLLR